VSAAKVLHEGVSGTERRSPQPRRGSSAACWPAPVSPSSVPCSRSGIMGVRDSPRASCRLRPVLRSRLGCSVGAGACGHGQGLPLRPSWRARPVPWRGARWSRSRSSASDSLSDRVLHRRALRGQICAPDHRKPATGGMEIYWPDRRSTGSVRLVLRWYPPKRG
jgi:hypothetical protein